MNFKISDFIQLIDNNLTEVSPYYGDSSRGKLAIISHQSKKYSLECVYSLETFEVISLSIDDYSRDVIYRFSDASHSEGLARVIYLEVLEDFLEKAKAIINGEEYDHRVSISLSMTKDELYDLMYAAHLKDITVNQFIIAALTDACNQDE